MLTVDATALAVLRGAGGPTPDELTEVRVEKAGMTAAATSLTHERHETLFRKNDALQAGLET
ncbi:hypothetical protein [Rhodovulum kholense]|nr:hypothetical protein [Rhodovulum kholense]